jgi:hypothetical protein
MSQPRRGSVLTSQRIDETRPGSVLADFDVLLAFLEEGVEAGGKHHLLPMARLFELDAMMTRPLRPRLTRPQQKSFPHINGLYLLLRATQLGVVQAHGKGSRLVLDPAIHEQWLRLNATERYFNQGLARQAVEANRDTGRGNHGQSGRVHHPCVRFRRRPPLRL